MTKLKNITVYLSEDEKKEYQQCAQRENKTLSTWLRDSIKSNPVKYPDSFYDVAAKYNMEIEVFIKYAIEMLDHVHIENNDLVNELTKENQELKARLYVLEHPEPPIDKYKEMSNKIFNIIDSANGKWISEKELIANFDIQNEDDHEDYLIARHTFEINYVQDGQFEYNRNRFRKVI